MKNWLKKFSKFWKLNWDSKQKLICISWHLMVFYILLKILSFSTFKKVYQIYSKRKSTSIFFEKYQQKIVYFVEIAASYLPFLITCLHKALVVKYYLRNDEEVSLIIGVQSSDSGFEAHAWVEKQNAIIIGEQPNSTFQPIWEWQSL